jgi:hypothetical protein
LSEASLSSGIGGAGVVSGSEASPTRALTGRIKRWLLAEVVEDVPGPEAKGAEASNTPGGRWCA